MDTQMSAAFFSLRKPRPFFVHITVIFFIFLCRKIPYGNFPHSFRIAARGLSFMARLDGKNPAAMPMSTAKMTDATASHGGI